MKLPSPIAHYLYLFRIWLGATMGLFLAAISHSYAMQIEGAEILSGQMIEGGLIIARTDPSNQVTLGDNQIRIAKNGVFSRQNADFVLENCKASNGNSFRC